MVAEERPPTNPAVFNDFSRHSPIENFMTIDGLLKSHASEAEQRPLICYPKDGVDDFEEYTAADIDSYANAAAAFYIESGLLPAVINYLTCIYPEPSEFNEADAKHRIQVWTKLQ